MDNLSIQGCGDFLTSEWKETPTIQDLEIGASWYSFVPYLYLFVSNVLIYMINDPAYGIKGMTLPDGSFVKIAFFVDDTKLYLQGSEKNMEHIFEVLEFFCSSLGEK
jgi:hypothetical protein